MLATRAVEIRLHAEGYQPITVFNAQCLAYLVVAFQHLASRSNGDI